MRRTLLIATGALALALALPGAALAHHHRGHQHSHGLRAHHAKFHVMHFGRASTTPIAPTSSTPSTTSSPATTPTTPTQENAGTVKSYEKEVLTITLNDGSTVSGKVTNDTRIQCIASQPATPTTGQPSGQDADDDSGPGDDQGGDNNQQGDEGNWGGDGNWGDQQGEDDSAPDQASTEPPCDSSALITTGAPIVIRYAELRIGPAGTEFESIWIVR